MARNRGIKAGTGTGQVDKRAQELHVRLDMLYDIEEPYRSKRMRTESLGIRNSAHDVGESASDAIASPRAPGLDKDDFMAASNERNGNEAVPAADVEDGLAAGRRKAIHQRADAVVAVSEPERRILQG